MDKKVVQLKQKSNNEDGGVDMNTLVAVKNDVYTSAISKEVKGDELLLSLKETGKRLNKMLNLNEEQINNAIKEYRKEWK